MNETGIGGRVINFLVDTLLVFAISSALHSWYIFYVRYWSYPFVPYYQFFFGFQVVYYTIFEALLRRTPGKFLSLSKVVRKDGRRPSFLQVLIRALIRVSLISQFFIPFFGRPLHDQLSGTRVVEK